MCALFTFWFSPYLFGVGKLLPSPGVLKSITSAVSEKSVVLSSKSSAHLKFWSRFHPIRAHLHTTFLADTDLVPLSGKSKRSTNSLRN